MGLKRSCHHVKMAYAFNPNTIRVRQISESKDSLIVSPDSQRKAI